MDIVFKKTGSRGNSTIISDGLTTLLIDCGIPCKDFLKEEGIFLSNIDGCLITHKHQDHCRYIKEIIKSGINCYSSLETFEDIGLQGYFLKPVKHNESFNINTFFIKPFSVPHTNLDGEECLNFGYLIYSKNTKEKALYVTDCHYIPYRFPACQYYFIEINYDEIEDKKFDIVKKRRLRSHQSLNTAMLFFKKQDLSKCKAVYPIHISENSNNIKKHIKRELKKINIKDVYF